MLYKISAMGIINARSMGEYSADPCSKVSNNYPLSILCGLRQGNFDYIYDKYWIQKIANILNQDEILLVHQCEDYFKLSLTTYMQSQIAYKQWCEVNQLVAKNAANLRRFVREVRIIWD